MQTVRNTEELRQALAAGHKADQIEMAHPITQAQVDKARQEGVAEGRAAGEKEGADKGAKAERERISKIHSMARKGFDAELKAAIDGGHTPEAFAMTLLEASKERGISLEAIQADSKAPAAHGGQRQGAGGNSDQDDATALLVGAMKATNERSK